LHTSVLDDRGKFVEGLTQDNFRVYEDKAEQSFPFSWARIFPSAAGLVIDNSGSMRQTFSRKRSRAHPVQAAIPRTSLRGQF
jgi:hypothetical protein